MPEVEGLPVLKGLTGLTAVDTPLSMDSEVKNEGVDTLTLLTVDNTPHYAAANDYVTVLGMPASDAIELWQSVGAPIIHLGPGANCLDLGKLLSRHDVSPQHLGAIRVWLEEQLGGAG